MRDELRRIALALTAAADAPRIDWSAVGTLLRDLALVYGRGVAALERRRNR
jgi:hypothetical protein